MTTRAEYATNLRKMYAGNCAESVILGRTIDPEGRRARFTVGRRGESFYMAEVAVLSWGTLFVHGDVDTVTFSRCHGYRTWRDVLDWMRKADADYAEEKARIGSGCDAMALAFDSDIARTDLARYRREGYLDRETARAARDALDEGDEWTARSIVAQADAELDFGKVTRPRVYMALAVIERLCQLLDDEAPKPFPEEHLLGEAFRAVHGCAVPLAERELRWEPTSTGIGTKWVVECEQCGGKQDVTDYANW